jgi:hypothetical protein
VLKLQEPEQKAVVIMASEKTLPVAIAVSTAPFAHLIYSSYYATVQIILSSFQYD